MLLLLLVSLSCVPVPVLSPPMRISAAIGPAFPTPGDMSGPPAEIDLDIGLAPLAVFPELVERSWDPVVGVSMAFPFLNDADLSRIGGFGQLRYRAWMYPLKGERRLVAGPDTSLVFAAPLDGGPLSVGFRVGGSLEIEGWSAGPSVGVGTGGGFLGVAWGQWSFGIGSTLGVRSTGLGPATTWTLGLVGNAPASAGFALVPIPF